MKKCPNGGWQAYGIKKMGLIMKYFVLKPRSKDNDDMYAFASREAYADAIESTNPRLAQDLRDWRAAELQSQIGKRNENILPINTQ